MEILCKTCGNYFFPEPDSMDQIYAEFIDPSSINICTSCNDLLQLGEYDRNEMSCDCDCDMEL